MVAKTYDPNGNNRDIFAYADTRAALAENNAKAYASEMTGLMQNNAEAYTDKEVAAAEGNAKKYTDEKIAAIPDPNVSGHISAHNTSGTAHGDIRTVAANAASAAATAQGTADEAKTNAAAAHSLAESKASTFTVAVTVDTGWTKDGDYYYKDVTATGIAATDNPIVDINAGSDNAANLKYSEAMCKVFRITTSDNSIRVWATEAIDIAFPIQLKVVR